MSTVAFSSTTSLGSPADSRDVSILLVRQEALLALLMELSIFICKLIVYARVLSNSCVTALCPVVGTPCLLCATSLDWSN